MTHHHEHGNEHSDDHGHGRPTLDDNPGLEHDEALEEGRPMTGVGSVGAVRRADAAGADERVTRDDDPGLEHDAATRAGRMMTGEGSIPRRADDA